MTETNTRILMFGPDRQGKIRILQKLQSTDGVIDTQTIGKALEWTACISRQPQMRDAVK